MHTAQKDDLTVQPVGLDVASPAGKALHEEPPERS